MNQYGDEGAKAPVDERFQLDDSTGSLVRSLVVAVSAMFLAYSASLAVATVSGLDTGVVGFVFTGGLLAIFGTVSIYVASARPIRRALRVQKDAVLATERLIREEAGQHRFASQIQDALEMGETEDDAFAVAGRAFAEITDQRCEVLIADSSRAHLRAATSSAGATGVGCSVSTPWGCPAVRRGQTLRFSSSTSLAACPRLAERGEPCSAVCVPVTVLGTPMGVVHVVGQRDVQPADSQVLALEALALHVGSRVGVLRVMASSQLQAATDPLTGAANRRTLEERMRLVEVSGTRYAVAFADLDHFKDLNDTHGHATGDRALRKFCEVLTASVRSEDVVCRYGGEEFVVLLPGLDRQVAGERMNAVRAEMEMMLASGDVPRVSASFGVADSSQATTCQEIIDLADRAMFEAKTSGRDRVVVAETTILTTQGD